MTFCSTALLYSKRMYISTERTASHDYEPKSEFSLITLMASTEPTKDAPEAPPVSEAPAVASSAPVTKSPPPPPFNLFGLDLFLRLALFATTLVSVILMVVSKQTKYFGAPFSRFLIVLDAKFVYSPALIYFVAAISTACLYSIISGAISAYGVFRPSPANKFLFHLATLDALMLGVVASATGAVAAVAYLGLRGNSHVGWVKVCNIYTKFCSFVASSVAISLASTIILLILLTVSIYSLHRRSHALIY
ncbi:putative casparian strip membrane protein [Dioscorea sansibarensis]